MKYRFGMSVLKTADFNTVEEEFVNLNLFRLRSPCCSSGEAKHYTINSK